MRIPYCLILLLFLNNYTVAQQYSSYETPVNKMIYSEALQDTINVEITVPKELKFDSSTAYPIIYLLDKQLYNNYKYNLHTIDYLSTLQWMPKAIVVGIPFSYQNRNKWTNPNETGGVADDLIKFIKNELNSKLKSEYPVSNFNLLIGHSRTAIFSSYALSKSPEFFNGAIASSVANFDFGDDYQKRQFNNFINDIDTSSHNYYYYFSVGEEVYGDLHEAAVDTLNVYLSIKKLPQNFRWKYYKHKISHELTPGLTVNHALSEIFKEYGRRIDVCFNIAEKITNKVPWEEFLEVYTKISDEFGFVVEPSHLFFNSIASSYYNDYDNIYHGKHLHFALEILLKAIERYPESYDYYAWAGEVYLTLKDSEKGEKYLNKSIELINKDKTVSEIDRTNYIKEIEAMKQKN